MGRLLDHYARKAVETAIRQAGTTATLHRTEPSSYNPATSDGDPGTLELVELRGYFRALNARALPEGVRLGDRQFVASAANLETFPTVSDILEHDDKAFTVVQVEPIAPTGTAIGFVLTLRSSGV